MFILQIPCLVTINNSPNLFTIPIFIFWKWISRIQFFDQLNKRWFNPSSWFLRCNLVLFSFNAFLLFINPLFFSSSHSCSMNLLIFQSLPLIIIILFPDSVNILFFSQPSEPWIISLSQFSQFTDPFELLISSILFHLRVLSFHPPSFFSGFCIRYIELIFWWEFTPGPEIAPLLVEGGNIVFVGSKTTKKEGRFVKGPFCIAFEDRCKDLLKFCPLLFKLGIIVLFQQKIDFLRLLLFPFTFSFIL